MSLFRLSQTDSVLIVHNGTPDQPCASFALTELRRILTRFGVTSDVYNAYGPEGVSWLRILPVDMTGGAGLPTLQGILHDGYLLELAEEHVLLAATCEKGLLNGVYDLVEQWGMVFVHPGAAGEWLPWDERPLDLPAEQRVVNPTFAHRGVQHHPDNTDYTLEEWVHYYAKLRLNTVMNRSHLSRAGSDWPLIEETGMRFEAGGTGLSGLLPRSLHTGRPELFRMPNPEHVDDHRDRLFNFCPSHPDVRRIVREHYDVLLRWRRGFYALHADPDTIAGRPAWCACPLCASLDPADQALLATSHLAEAIQQRTDGPDADPLDAAEQMRVPFLAGSAAPRPGGRVTPAASVFLHLDPRRRCHVHAIDDPGCARNHQLLPDLVAWLEQFRDQPDTHLGDLRGDMVAFRGHTPFLPDAMLADLRTWSALGVETYMLHRRGALPGLPDYSLLLFARACFDPELTAPRFLTEIAECLSPDSPEGLRRYLQERSALHARLFAICSLPPDQPHDLLRLSPHPQPGSRLAERYANAADILDQLAMDLQTCAPRMGVSGGDLARLESARASCEAAECRAMAAQQHGLAALGRHLLTHSEDALRTARQTLPLAVAAAEDAADRARDLGYPDEHPYFKAVHDPVIASIKQILAPFIAG